MARPIRPKSDGRRITAASKRAADLQRRIGASSGIQFDTDPQDGDWLVVTTSSADPIRGKGMYFHTTNGNPLELLSSALHLFAENQGGALGTIQFVNYGDDSFLIQAAGSGDVTIQADPGSIELRSSSEVYVSLAQTGAKFSVYAHLIGSVFEVRDDGTVHILTGTTVVADL